VESPVLLVASSAQQRLVNSRVVASTMRSLDISGIPYTNVHDLNSLDQGTLPSHQTTVLFSSLTDIAGELRALSVSRRIVVVQAEHFPWADQEPIGAREAIPGTDVTFCVWGPASRHAIESQFSEPRIIITGPPGSAEREDFEASLGHQSPPAVDADGAIVVLHDGEETTLEAAHHLSQLLKTTIGQDVEVRDSVPRGASIAIANSSADYLETIRVGIPLIVLNTRDSPALPLIKHHLIAHAESVDHAKELVVRTLAEAQFLPNSTGDLIERYAVPGSGAAGVVDAIRGHAAAAEQIPPKMRATIIGTNFGRHVGLAIPIMTLASHLVRNGMATVRYLDARAFSFAEAIESWTASDDIVIVNGFESLSSRPALRRYVRERLMRGRDVFVYIHLTEAGIERERTRRPADFEDALRLLKRTTVLCVSQHQARLFNGLGVKNTIVVYNTSPSVANATAPIVHHHANTTQRTITMVGSVQDRKGVDLFSKTADLAKARHPEWQFEWIGGRNGMLSDSSLISPNVRWHGALPRAEVEERLSQSDVFLLSSTDDPMPLAAVEAISAGTRVVSYSRVGTSELLAGSAGYASFHQYSAESALDAVENVLESEPDVETWSRIRGIFTVESFASRVLHAVRSRRPLSREHPRNPGVGLGVPPPFRASKAIMEKSDFPEPWNDLLVANVVRHDEPRVRFSAIRLFLRLPGAVIRRLRRR
jgi:glycosyltransferase involved in cell wall biosynthesis